MARISAGGAVLCNAYDLLPIFTYEWMGFHKQQQEETIIYLFGRMNNLCILIAVVIVSYMQMVAVAAN